MWKCWCETFFTVWLFFFFLSPLFHRASQMARRQTSRWTPMKTSISSRVHWNCTSGICPFPSSRTTRTPGSSRLQVRHNYAANLSHYETLQLYWITLHCWLLSLCLFPLGAFHHKLSNLLLSKASVMQILWLLSSEKRPGIINQAQPTS